MYFEESEVKNATFQDINKIRYESGEIIWHSADNPRYSLELISGNSFDITVACIISNATTVRFIRQYLDGSSIIKRVPISLCIIK